MKNKTITVERTFDTDIQSVWRALTEPGLMKQWYFDLDEFRPEVGFQFTFPGQGHKGEQFIHICQITEVVPNKKLQYSWTYKNTKGYSLVTFELFDIGKERTKLVLTHSGLETFPQDNPDFASESFNKGWKHIINIALKEFLDK